MPRERDVLQELLSSGTVDWVSLDDVVWLATEGERASAAKKRTLRVLSDLFTNGLMVPGDLGETGFEDWAGSADDWLKRALAELDRLDWSPMGAGFWLRLTEQGRAHLAHG